MRPWSAFLMGAGLATGIAYYLNPSLGAQRRAQLRDKTRRVPRKIRENAEVTARDIKNRSVGFINEARARFTEGAVDDDVLRDRVRSKLGFLVRHPSAIEVDAQGGVVRLHGPVLSDEVQQLIDGVRSVRGVRQVDNRLEVHADSNDVPALQGDKPKPTGQPLDIMQRNWSPATRFLVGAAGLLLAYNVARPGHRRAA